MHRPIETIYAKPRRQLIELAQMRNRKHVHHWDRSMILELYEQSGSPNGGVDVTHFDDKQLELIATLATKYLREVS